MERKFLHIALFLTLVLWSSCSSEQPAVIEEGESKYMQLSLRSGEDSGSDKPCFIFWKQTDYLAPGFATTPTTPYIWCWPGGEIDNYKTTKYNTGEVYPPNSESVYAVGVSPGSIVPSGNTNWYKLGILKTLAGITDIQCAPVIIGNEQNHFSDPLVFEHQLTRLEVSGYCGSSMKIVEADGTTRTIKVTDIKVTLKGNTDDQWKWFPESLEWKHPNNQYEVEAYTTKPSPEISATVFTPETLTPDNTTETDPEPIGNFYLVPGFNSVTIEIEAKYIDSTTDETSPSGNGQVITRMWSKVEIKEIYPNGAIAPDDVTAAGESYKIKLVFDRSKIELGVTLEGWGPDEDN